MVFNLGFSVQLLYIKHYTDDHIKYIKKHLVYSDY